MKKRLVVGISLILSLLAYLATGCSPGPSLPGSLTDDFGRVIAIDETPERIVSHVPSATEILFALGLGEKVVGVSSYCDYPPEAKLKPQVGDFWNPSVESIVALEPDLVFTMGDKDALMAGFDALGIPYIVLQPEDINGVLGDIELVGRVTNTEKQAEKLVSEMQERISNVVSRVKDARQPKVFYVIDASNLSAPWTAGPGSFIDSLITMAGGENIGAKAKARWSEFSMEELVSSDPDIIILPVKDGTAFTSPEVFRADPIWGKLAAVKQGKIFTIDDDLVSLYGPRIVLGLEEMAKIIHPELFP